MNHTNTTAPIGADARSSFIRWYAGFLLSDEMHAAHVWDNNHIPAQAWRAALASAAQPADQESSADGALISLLAECRNAFPVPPPGDPLGSSWACAMSDPSEVPGYLRAIAAAPKAAPAAQGDARLWCVHVQGPDDVHPMPSRAAALERANELNECFGRHRHEEGDPIMRAVVMEWPHAADLHVTALYKRAMADAARAAKEGDAP